MRTFNPKAHRNRISTFKQKINKLKKQLRVRITHMLLNHKNSIKFIHTQSMVSLRDCSLATVKYVFGLSNSIMCMHPLWWHHDIIVHYLDSYLSIHSTCHCRASIKVLWSLYTCTHKLRKQYAIHFISALSCHSYCIHHLSSINL